MNETVREPALALGNSAKAAARDLARACTKTKDEALSRIAADLRSSRQAILEANARDVGQAVLAGLAPALVDRLTLDEERLLGVAQAVLDVRALPDPVGEVTESSRRPNGLEVFVAGRNHALYSASQTRATRSGWSGWRARGGRLGWL